VHLPELKGDREMDMLKQLSVTLRMERGGHREEAQARVTENGILYCIYTI